MGLFFISNSSPSLPVARQFIGAKGFAPPREVVRGNVTVLAYKKLFAAKYEHFFSQNADFVIGFGTYFTAANFGDAALPEILEAFRDDPSSLGEVGGNFCFVFGIGSDLFLVTDKTGVFHVHCGRNGNEYFISPSLFAVANALPRLHVGEQELLEFTNTETVFGGRTIFDEVQHLEPASTYKLTNDGLERIGSYYQLTDRPASFEESRQRILALVRPALASKYSVSCDLTGGYDSRTVASFLEATGLGFSYNTNTNSDDPTDVELAQKLAQASSRRLDVHVKKLDPAKTKALIAETTSMIEMARDNYAAFYTPVYFRDKAAKADIVIGGYGGETFRDVYSKFKSVEELVEKNYTRGNLFTSGAARDNYKTALQVKFNALLTKLGERDIKKGVEKIYILEKMRYWGGSRITAFNQYCFHFHPLMDHIALRMMFDVSIHDKRDALLQKRFIAANFPPFAPIKTSYGDNCDPLAINRLFANKHKWPDAARLFIGRHIPKSVKRVIKKPRINPYVEQVRVSPLVEAKVRGALPMQSGGLRPEGTPVANTRALTLLTTLTAFEAKLS